MQAEALGLCWALWQILVSFAQIGEDANQAAQLRQEAQTLIAYIADHTSNTESFLSLPTVRRMTAPLGQ